MARPPLDDQGQKCDDGHETQSDDAPLHDDPLGPRFALCPSKSVGVVLEFPSHERGAEHHAQEARRKQQEEVDHIRLVRQREEAAVDITAPCT